MEGCMAGEGSPEGCRIMANDGRHKEESSRRNMVVVGE